MVNAEDAILVTTDSKKESSKGNEKDKGTATEAQQEEMPEEDKKLQADLNMIIERLSEQNQELYKQALESLRTIIRSSTTSMTSVPKPLKYMIPHYSRMKEIFEKIANNDVKKLCADIISVLAMCSDDSSEQQDCVNYRLMGSGEDIGQWGHEYVRHVCKGVIDEWRKCDESNAQKNDSMKQKLLKLVREILVYNLKHNAEVEACDLLIEIEQLSLLLEEPFSTDLDYTRICLYLLSCVPYMPFPENQTLRKCAMNLYLSFNHPFEALRCAIMLNDMDLINKIFTECQDRLVQKQMAILLGRHQIFLEISDDCLAEHNANTHLHSHFLSLTRELDIMAPKSPEDIYKSHLEQSRPFQTQTADAVRQNIAATFVNGFVNCGFGTDTILEKDDKSANDWYQRNKEHASLSAAASLGLVHRWDVDNGLSKCDQFLYGTSEYIQAGTLLAIGIIFSGIQDPVDPACALLQDKLHDPKSSITRIGATLGLGLAYANSKRNTVVLGETCVISDLRKVLNEPNSIANSEIKGLAALSLGLILVGTSNDEVALELLNYLMEGSADFKDTNTRLVALGIALIYLGTQERSEVIVDAVRALPDPFGSMTSILVDACAYAGTGNVLKIQSLLHICSEHNEQEKKEDKKEPIKKPSNNAPLDITAPPPAGTAPNTATQKSEEESSANSSISSRQAVATLGIGLIAMGEQVGSQMSLRVFSHLTRYGEPAIRRAVPLALALTSISNPQLTIMETLAKYSRDSDSDTARNAIFALGLIGAGTNNARLVALLRQLASYHTKDQITMMLIRISQGFIHLGKGTMTMNPFHSDRQLMCPAAVAAILSLCYVFIDAEHTVLSRQHYLLYTLVVAIQPRMMITLIEDEEDNTGEMERRIVQKPIQVRVGQAVDVVAQAGQPRAITGFQTHTSPVLLAYGERAELATDDYVSLTPFLEGLVILRKKESDTKIMNGFSKH